MDMDGRTLDITTARGKRSYIRDADLIAFWGIEAL